MFRIQVLAIGALALLATSHGYASERAACAELLREAEVIAQNSRNFRNLVSASDQTFHVHRVDGAESEALARYQEAYRAMRRQIVDFTERAEDLEYAARICLR